MSLLDFHLQLPNCWREVHRIQLQWSSDSFLSCEQRTVLTMTTKRSKSIRHDSIGSEQHHEDVHAPNLESLTYEEYESDAFRAFVALDHYHYRGSFWNSRKHEVLVRYALTAAVGITQGAVAYGANLLSNSFIQRKFESVNTLLVRGHTVGALTLYLLIQTSFAMLASMFVWIEPVSAGSGIPEVKCFLNGVDIPNIGAPRTILCKVLGVTCSVSAGLPVGKEGPMVHSGAVVATTLSSGKTRNDREVRDFVACGAAAGVCSAFSAPIGGILFALEEGASYWSPSLTWRCFFCSMCALTTLYTLNSIGSEFGKVGFNKLFSFGNFLYEENESSFAVYELFVFILIGVMGGLIGAVFNNTNEKITHWRIKNVNYCKKRRFCEVVLISMLVSTIQFALSLLWVKCTPLPEDPEPHEIALLEDLAAFRCDPGAEYNELASLMFVEPGIAIRQLFHLKKHAFSDAALTLFFIPYIVMAVVVYGIAIPSGLFVPSLLSGAALGRLTGNLLHKINPSLACSNTYALVGAAAVLGGMARMTISLTVILLECTGNEQYVLPLMLTLMTARLVGGLFNDDLYHIHIHLKKGVSFLEAELKSIGRHNE
jgi:chloride channel 7